MGTLDAIGKKVKGKAQQLKGDVNQERGEGLKGGIQKLKGKVNDTVGDTKLESEDAKRRNDSRD